MKGPGYKITGDVRRTWRCSQCGREQKMNGDVTSLSCVCQDNVWMQIVSERIIEPRPLQRPSDVERRPIDFGIEPTPPPPPKEEATIIKSAISRDPEPNDEPTTVEPETPKTDDVGESEEEWGEGIL